MREMKKMSMFLLTALSVFIFSGYTADLALAKKQEKKIRVFVKAKPGLSQSSLNQIKSLKVRHQFPNGQFSTELTEAEIERLKEIAEVETVPVYSLPVEKEKVDKTIRINETTCMPENQLEYNVVQVNGGQAGGGEGITVAVLDTGIDTDHPDLVDNIVGCIGFDGSGNPIEDCEDTDGHGTLVAGIIAANGGPNGTGSIGVAPAANIIAIQVCGFFGCFLDDIVEGINQAAANGADIVNMSFGGPTGSKLIKNAIKAHPEVLYIAASGNEGPRRNTIGFPAGHKQVVAVAANDENMAITRFSSRGIKKGPKKKILKREVELSAGGDSIEGPTVGGCYSALSGTSFSSPTIAGLAAKLWNQGGANAQSVRSFLRTNTIDITEADGPGAKKGIDIASGFGLPVAQ